jgi:hypothetical protein
VAQLRCLLLARCCWLAANNNRIFKLPGELFSFPRIQKLRLRNNALASLSIERRIRGCRRRRPTMFNCITGTYLQPGAAFMIFDRLATGLLLQVPPAPAFMRELKSVTRLCFRLRLRLILTERIFMALAGDPAGAADLCFQHIFITDLLP